MNWRALLGAQSRPALKEVVHFEHWSSVAARNWLGDDVARRAVIERQLEVDPLLILPVLNKSSLAVQPVSKVVWAGRA